jgi:Uma2 family endonuclease
MKWQEVCEHPSLKDLPFKIELNERGQLLMTPVKVYYSLYRGRIAALLRQHTDGGEVLVECAIATGKGTKVADVAWISAERFAPMKDEVECSMAPEICIEVPSDGNTTAEMSQKRRLYFSKGASEVWICDAQGGIRFFDTRGELDRSVLAPGFPTHI